jgi:hypothetical protein
MAEPTARHESSDIAVREVLRIGVVLAVAVVAATLLIGVVVRAVVGRLAAPAAANATIIPAPPRLQPDPHADLVAARAEQRALLTGWAWTDSTHRYARIPIERAMQIEAERHGSLPPPASP